MNRDEREVKLGNFDGLDVDGDTAKPAEPPASAKRGGSPPTPPPPSAPVGNGGKKGSAGVALLFLMVLLLAGMFGYKMWLQEQRFNRAMAQAQAQIDVLQAQLSDTGETLVESSDQLLNTVRRHGSEISTNKDEIRKLWDVSNKRNRGWIEENREAIAELKKAQEPLSGLPASVRSATQKAESAEQAIAQLRRQVTALDGVSQKADNAVSTANSSRQAAQSNERQISTLTDQLATLRRESQALRGQVLQLESQGGQMTDTQVRDIEEAIAAFDSYRLQVNRRLERIENNMQRN